MNNVVFTVKSVENMKVKKSQMKDNNLTKNKITQLTQKGFIPLY